MSSHNEEETSTSSYSKLFIFVITKGNLYLLHSCIILVSYIYSVMN